MAAGYPAEFPPGDRYSYSNTNYVVLGLALAKVSGLSLTDLVQRRIAGALHLKHTYLSTGSPRPDRFDRSRLAHGYGPEASELGPLLPPGTPPGTALRRPATRTPRRHHLDQQQHPVGRRRRDLHG